jgi:phage terminase small subunit
MPKERDLTTQQRTAIEAHASGASLQEAGEAAGYAERGAYVTVHKLLKKAKAKEYLAELRVATTNDKIATISEIKEVLTGHLRGNQAASIMDQQRAASELNKMLGGHEPERHEVEFVINIGGNAE